LSAHSACHGRRTDRVILEGEKAMTRGRNAATMLALCSIAVLPACSMFGGNNRTQSNRTAYPTQSYAAATQSQELSQDMIQKVQGRLQQQGLYHGNVDGVWGPGTESAVRSYQQQHNLNATGKLDSDTLASLNLGPNQNYGSAQPQPSDQRYGSNYNPPPNNNAPSDTVNPPNTSNAR
jgi:peptidoglycan hydrolase-like protein with peptidoglycan-binding domain